MTVNQITNLAVSSFGPFTANPMYNRMIFNWLFLRDAIEGESAIKFKNELYLPMPTSMQIQPTEAMAMQQWQYYSQFHNEDEIKSLYQHYNPNYHTNPAYRSYITRARFPEITSHVLRGLIGLVFKEPVTFNLPKELEYLMEQATVSGLTLPQLFSHVLEETLTTGREILTYDYNESFDNIFMAPYAAESTINWKYNTDIGSDFKLKGLRLIEKIADNFNEEPQLNLKSTSLIKVQNILDLIIDNTGTYITKMYSRSDSGDFDKNSFTQITPSYKGKTLSSIPAVCIGSINNSFKINPSPMLPIARSSQHIYMKSADLSQSEFLSCSPMLVISGGNAEEAPKAIGSTICLILENPEAKALYTKTDTSALSHVRQHMIDLYNTAIQLGAQLLDTSNRPAETADTTKMRQGASTATLISTLSSVVYGFESIIKSIAIWKGISPENISIIPNKDFLPMSITGAEVREIVQAWMNDAISKQTMYKTLQDAGIAQEDVNFESEQKRILEEYNEPGSPKAIRREAFTNANRGANKSSDTDIHTTQENNIGE